MGQDLTNKSIQSTYEDLVQISGSQLTDGTGSLISSLDITASNATSASFATTASYAENVEPFDSGSLLITASISDAEITFTKGDASTFAIEVNNVSSSISASHALQADNATNAVSAETALNTIVSIKNMESLLVIPKGTPLYVSASGTMGNIAGVYIADAGNPNRMPAGLIAGESLIPGAEGVGFVDGFINGVDTSAFNSGDEVFVAVGGGYTNVAPTGSTNQVQHLGYIEKADANGSGVIQMSGESRGLPNLQQDYVWVGDSNGVPQAVPSSSLVSPTPTLEEVLTAGNVATTDITGSNALFTTITAQSASFGHITTKTGSAVIIGDEFIILNADTPTNRYAGIQIYDSGSFTTASFEWDGQQDVWVQVDEAGNSGVMLTAPEGVKGAEVFPTANTLQKGTGTHTLADSSITDNGTLVNINADVQVSGFVSSSERFYVQDRQYSQGALGTAESDKDYLITANNSGTGTLSLRNSGGNDSRINLSPTEITITGSVDSQDNITAPTFIGDLQGNADTATTASYAENFDVPTLQQVSDEGATTDNAITLNQASGSIPLQVNSLIGGSDTILRLSKHNANSNNFVFSATDATAAFLSIGNSAGFGRIDFAGRGANEIRSTAGSTPKLTINTPSLILTGDVSGSGFISASTYYGDGSNLTGISTSPFPYTGSAEITGSLGITGSISSGGDDNTATGLNSAVIGGSNNSVDRSSGAIIGGSDNTYGTNGGGGVIVGGNSNTLSETWSVIAGGFGNNSNQGYSFMGGGRLNSNTGQYGGVIGGQGLSNQGARGVAIGGNGNNNQTYDSGIFAGTGNLNSQGISVIVGGSSHRITKANSVRAGIFAGNNNDIIGNFGDNEVIIGGENHIIKASEATYRGKNNAILGGSSNQITDNNTNVSSSAASVILGGVNNSIRTDLFSGTQMTGSAILGGGNHQLTHNRSVIIGGDGLLTTQDDEVVVPNLTISGSGAVLTFADGTTQATAGGGGGAAFPYTGSAEITGSLILTGSIEINNPTDGINNTALPGVGTANLAVASTRITAFASNAQVAFIAGTDTATIGSGVNQGVILGAAESSIGGTRNAVVGGYDNDIGNVNNASIFGGIYNDITSATNGATLVGGNANLISGGTQPVLLGGESNTISSGENSAIIAGSGNTNTQNRSVVIGGSSLSTSKADEVVVPNLTTNGAVVQNVEALSIVANVAELDASLGNLFTLTLQNGVNTEVELINQTAGQTFQLQITNNATSAGTISFDSQFDFEGGTAFTATATTGAIDILTFVCFGGGNVQCVGAKNFS